MTCHSQPWKRLGRFTKKNLHALTHSMENDWNTHRSGRNQRKPISKHSLTGLQSKPISKLWTYFTHFVSRLQNSYIKEAFSHIKRWSGLKVKPFHQTSVEGWQMALVKQNNWRRVMEKRKNPICKAVRHQIAHFSLCSANLNVNELFKIKKSAAVWQIT